MIEKAIVVYLDDSDRIEEEFSWLYKTWKLHSLDNEFDLVVYHDPGAKSRVDKYENIVKIEMGPIRLSNYYKFLKSHYFCMDEWNEPLRKYKYLLKTDCDVFLTKNMKGYIPSKTMIGSGGYYDQNDDRKIAFFRSISKKLNIPYNNMSGIGASFFGKTDIIIKLVNNQINITEYLLTNLFKENRLDNESGFDSGISSMIGGEIAVNMMFKNQHVSLYTLDSKCWETTNIGSDVIHIHAWHTVQPWSKHSYFNDEYKDWNVEFHDMYKSAAHYCHWIATTPLDKILKIR